VDKVNVLQIHCVLHEGEGNYTMNKLVNYPDLKIVSFPVSDSHRSSSRS